ncbi:MAG: AAA family ATPase [Saprospiraceae bacterium]|jgi:AAA15 family ATPase/GTPase|nr:AAA family ATPase [Saprospiraceae bacterium]
MSVLIKNIHIKNFKSVRDLSLDCERINIFIGKPNAGKSNILEAISLLGAGYSKSAHFMSEFIRYSKIPQLFSNISFREPISIESDNSIASLHFDSKTNDFSFVVKPKMPKPSNGDTPKRGVQLVPLHQNPLHEPLFEIEHILNDGSYHGARFRERPDRIKKYDFRGLGKYAEHGPFLHPPHGENFYFIAQSHPALQEEIFKFLKPNGLELLLDEESRRLFVVQKGEKSLISFPITSVPDTFQRYIFHLAAILSNRDSVLLFEEPESHSYPPYINQLAQHIVDDEGGNQFFITTHNPYLLTPILQEAKDVALFVTWFENFQTHARKLSEAELSDILSYGMDVFFNLKHFTPHEPSPDFA